MLSGGLGRLSMKNLNELLILKAEINEDIKAIDLICNNVKEKYSQLGGKKLDYFEISAFGYLLHNFYNACENLLLRIASVFENTIDKEEWHKDLLLQMKLDIENIRPRVIRSELVPLLDEYRRFRHLFRHAYSIQLDWEKINLLITKLEKTKSLFLEDIQQFIEFTDNLIKEF